MKYFALIVFFGFAISFIVSCKKYNDKPAFSYEKAAGIWVPYEITFEDGTVETGPFPMFDIFGAYDESVQLNHDKTFIPVTWTNRDTFNLSNTEAGTFEYTPDNKLKFTGPSPWMRFEFLIIKFENDDLWLQANYTSGEVLYKFKRQH